MGPWTVVERGGDLSVFRTREGAENSMEAPDVRDGEFRVYDGHGIEYAVTAENDNAPVKIGRALDGVARPEVLRDVVLDYVNRVPAHRRKGALAESIVDVSRVLAELAR
jgi:hypothetical protein